VAGHCGLAGYCSVTWSHDGAGCHDVGWCHWVAGHHSCLGRIPLQHCRGLHRTDVYSIVGAEGHGVHWRCVVCSESWYCRLGGLGRIDAFCNEREHLRKEVGVEIHVIEWWWEKGDFQGESCVDGNGDICFHKSKRAESDDVSCVGSWDVGSQLVKQCAVTPASAVGSSVGGELSIQTRKVHRQSDFGCQCVEELKADWDGRHEGKAELDVYVCNVDVERKCCERGVLEASDAAATKIGELEAGNGVVGDLGILA